MCMHSFLKKHYFFIYSGFFAFLTFLVNFVFYYFREVFVTENNSYTFYYGIGDFLYFVPTKNYGGVFGFNLYNQQTLGEANLDFWLQNLILNTLGFLTLFLLFYVVKHIQGEFPKKSRKSENSENFEKNAQIAKNTEKVKNFEFLEKAEKSQKPYKYEKTLVFLISVVFGAGLSNIAFRLIYGFVFDYLLILQIKAVFNFSDLLINLAVFGILIVFSLEIFHQYKTQKNEPNR